MKNREESAAHVACRQGHMPIIKFLHEEHKFDFNQVDEEEYTPIYTAIENNFMEIVVYLVEECKVDIDKPNIKGESPLHVACRTNKIEFVKYLIDRGADFLQKGKTERTILHNACYDGFTDLVEFILELPGIDIEAKDKEFGQTALHFAVWGLEVNRSRKKFSLSKADSPECARLLLEKGADPNSLNHMHQIPLITACLTNGFNCIDVLMEFGANVNRRDNYGNLAISSCFCADNMKCLEKLMAHKPETQKLLNTGYLPHESSFIDDHDKIFIRALQYDEFNITETTIEKCIYMGAKKCFKVIEDHLSSNP